MENWKIVRNKCIWMEITGGRFVLDLFMNQKVVIQGLKETFANVRILFLYIELLIDLAGGGFLESIFAFGFLVNLLAQPHLHDYFSLVPSVLTTCRFR